jgi:hypothetical protein
VEILEKIIEELLRMTQEEARKTSIAPRKFDRTEEGGLLLNPSDPFDKDWFENDKAYGIL